MRGICTGDYRGIGGRTAERKVNVEKSRNFLYDITTNIENNLQ